MEQPDNKKEDRFIKEIEDWYKCVNWIVVEEEINGGESQENEYPEKFFETNVPDFWN